MGNTLDLKNPPEPEHDVDTTTDVATPVEALEVPNSDAMNLDTLASLALAAAAPSTLAWQAHHPLQGNARRRYHYLLGVVVVAGGALAVWQSSFLVFAAVLLGAVAFWVRERWNGPTSIAITQHGVHIDGNIHPHAHLASFDIHTMPDGTNELSIRTMKWTMPHLRLPLGEQDPKEVRDILSQYVPEESHRMPVIDYFIRRP